MRLEEERCPLLPFFHFDSLRSPAKLTTLVWCGALWMNSTHRLMVIHNNWCFFSVTCRRFLLCYTRHRNVATCCDWFELIFYSISFTLVAHQTFITNWVKLYVFGVNTPNCETLFQLTFSENGKTDIFSKFLAHFTQNLHEAVQLYRFSCFLFKIKVGLFVGQNKSPGEIFSKIGADLSILYKKKCQFLG